MSKKKIGMRKIFKTLREKLETLTHFHGCCECDPYSTLGSMVDLEEVYQVLTEYGINIDKREGT